MSRHRILVTGGAGFIGSHTCKLLHREGFDPIVYDNLSTGNRTSVRWGPLIEADICDTAKLQASLEAHAPRMVIHFAASAYVGESVVEPEKYYRNNVAGMVSLLTACRAAGVDGIIFSSSCATYGIPQSLPITEDQPQNPISPYGRSKLIGEQMLKDFAHAYGTRYAILRYFNACGADPDGELGEWHEPETHLIPRALLAASGRIPELEIFGDDYETEDGTCVRDYVHVWDLAKAHVGAARHLLSGGDNIALNLGSGRGSSIRQILDSIEHTTRRKVPISIRPRREGDPAALYSDASRMRETLGIEASMSDLDTIMRTAAPFFGLESRP